MTERLRVSLKSGSAVRVTRLGVQGSRLVYVISQNREHKYPYGRSPVVYIGTTEKGIDRIATSAAVRAPQVLAAHGVDRFDMRIITCTPRRRMRSWAKLERALILCFREIYGEPPKFNKALRNMREQDEFLLFSRDRLKDILRSVEAAD